MRPKALLVLLIVPLLLMSGIWPEAASGPPQPRHSSAIALTDDGATLLVVNPDSNTLSLVDTGSHAILAELPVGIDPRTVTVDSAGRRAYVANRGSDNVSVVDLSVQLERPTDAEALNAAMKQAADGPLAGILQYNDEPCVSVDFLGNPHSSILDALTTKVMDGTFAKVLSWYDNEWGYSCRVVDLALMMGS